MNSMFGAEFDDAIERLARPTPDEYVTARSLLVEMLNQGRHPLEVDVRAEWATRLDIDPDPGSLIAERGADGRYVAPDRGHPHLAHRRMQRAVRQVIAEMYATGLIAPSTDGRDGPAMDVVSVHYDGGGNHVSIRNDSVAMQAHDDSRWRWLEPIQEPSSPEVLSRAGLVEGLDPLLGNRGLRCLLEAHDAYRRQLWLAAASLVAAASEAAWYSLGRRLAPEGGALARTVEEGRDARRVIDLSAQAALERELARSGDIRELATHGQYLRDVRNYGLHPAEDHDSDREAPFTEAGCTVLLLASRRYFTRLLAVFEAASLGR